MDYPTIIIIIIAIGVFLILRWFLRQLFQKYVSLRYPEVNANPQQNSNRPFTIEEGRSNMQVCNTILLPSIQLTIYFFVKLD